MNFGEQICRKLEPAEPVYGFASKLKDRPKFQDFIDSALPRAPNKSIKDLCTDENGFSSLGCAEDKLDLLFSANALCQRIQQTENLRLVWYLVGKAACLNKHPDQEILFEEPDF